MARPSIPSTLLAIAVAAALTATGVSAQAPTPGQADPNAVCPYQLNDQIQACRVQVYSIEAALPQGPCWASDWPCICNVQQGLLDCYAPCPGNTPQTDIDYNNANCAGQNGYSNAAAVQGGTPYSGGVLTTTGGAVGTGISTTAAVTTTSSSSVVQIPATTSTSPTADSTTIVSSAMTTTIPRAPGESTSNSVSDPKDLPTPVQSTSGNVFEGQSAGAAKLKVMNGGGLVQGVTLIGMTLAIMMLA